LFQSNRPIKESSQIASFLILGRLPQLQPQPLARTSANNIPSSEDGYIVCPCMRTIDAIWVGEIVMSRY